MENASEDFDVVVVMLLREGDYILQAEAKRWVVAQDRGEMIPVQDMPVEITPDERGFKLDSVTADIMRSTTDQFFVKLRAGMDARYAETFPEPQ